MKSASWNGALTPNANTTDRVPPDTGDDIDRAVFYPEDDEYLIDRETTVTHHEVARRLR